MIGRRSFSPAWLATVLGLIIGAAGIAILWAAGVVFPIYPPPGIILLVVGAIFVGLAPWRWVPLVGTLLGAFITVGFLISPTGLSNLSGGAGASVAIGQGIQVVGALLALSAGAVAARANYRRSARAG